MKILVIGGTGFIGSQVAKLLAEKGNDVTLFHRGNTKSDYKEILGDRKNLAVFKEQFKKTQTSYCH